jgi:hypothetical protein
MGSSLTGGCPRSRLPRPCITLKIGGARAAGPPRILAPTAFPATASEKAPERTSTPRQESRDGCVSGMLSFQLQKSPTPNFEEKCGNSSDISKVSIGNVQVRILRGRCRSTYRQFGNPVTADGSLRAIGESDSAIADLAEWMSTTVDPKMLEQETLDPSPPLVG